jgi:hypothetical protein
MAVTACGRHAAFHSIKRVITATDICMRALTQLVWWCVIGPLSYDTNRDCTSSNALWQLTMLWGWLKDVRFRVSCCQCCDGILCQKGRHTCPSFVRVPANANGCVALYSYVGEAEQDGCRMTDCVDRDWGMGMVPQLEA